MKTFSNPTKYPTVWTLAQTKKDIFIANEETFVGMKMNGRAVDETELYRRFKTTGQPMTIEDIKASLSTGAKFREPQRNEPDPDIGPLTCAACSNVSQPVVYTTEEGQRRGSFAEFKAERLASIADEMTRKEVSSNLGETTKAVFGGDSRLSNILVAYKCQECIRKGRPRYKDGDGDRTAYFPVASIRERALGHDTRISAAKRRNSVNSLFVSKRKGGGGKPSSSNRGEGSRTGGGYQKRTAADDRPRAEWHGQSFFKSTADAFAKAETDGKLTGGLKQVASMTDEELREIGAAYTELAAKTVRSIASQGIEKIEMQDKVREAAGVPTHLGEVARGTGELESLKRRLEAPPSAPAPRRHRKSRKKNKKDGWDRRSRRSSQEDGE